MSVLRSMLVCLVFSGCIPAPLMAPTVVTANSLPCSHAPCVLGNFVASGAGPKPSNETPIAVDPRNPLHLLVGANTLDCPHPPLKLGNAGLGYFASDDGGVHWKRTCGIVLGGSLPGGLDPVVAYGLNGTAFRGQIDYRRVGHDFELTNIVDWSTDNGATWSEPVIAARAEAPRGRFYGAGKDWMQIDTNSTSPRKDAIYISSLQFAVHRDGSMQEAFTVSHSTDSGRTWTSAKASPATRLPFRQCCGSLTIGDDGTVYHAWVRCKTTGKGSSASCGGTLGEMFLSESADGGYSWSKEHLIHRFHISPGNCDSNGSGFGCLPNTNEPINAYPVIAIDDSSGPYSGRLYVADYDWLNGHMEVQVAASPDRGMTWTKPVSVTGPQFTHDQFFPWISVSHDGTVGITWLDRRNDPANVSYEAFAAISADGGKSFSKNYQIAARPSDPKNDGVGGYFMGDYTGNGWAGKKLFVSWPDTSNGHTARAMVGGLQVP